MRDWVYTVRERCTRDSKIWQDSKDYFDDLRFGAVTEIVTLDSMLCPNIVEELRDEDWKHNVQEDFRVTLFRDPEYPLRRQPLDASRHQLLAGLEMPDGHETVPFGFSWCGFDIMDAYFGNSTLTGCGPIPEAFDPAIVNAFGLLDDCKTAIEVRDRMRLLQPDDDHLGACEVWAVARVLPDEYTQLVR